MTDVRADVVVVGAGPAGIAAACTAAESGATVALLDDNPEPGGQIWRGKEHQRGRVAAQWLARLQISGTKIYPRTCVLAPIADRKLLAERSSEPLIIQYKKLVLATGARELMLPFPGWTLPGVAGAGGLQALVESGLPIADKRVVVAGSGPLLLAVAAHLKERGARIMAVAEQTPLSKVAGFASRLSIGKIAQGAQLAWQLRGVRVLHSAWPVSGQGDDRLRIVRLHTQSGVRTFECDYLACGFGLVPNTELAQVCGCDVRDGYVAVDELQQTSVEGVLCAGEPTGIAGVDSSLVEGQIAGYVAAGVVGSARSLLKARHKHRRFSKDLVSAFSLRNELKKMCSPGTVVCRCEDVAWQDILKHDDWRSAKLQTRCGMGPCQGRICGAAIGFLTNQRLRFDSVRAPVFPASLETLASAPEIEADAAS